MQHELMKREDDCITDVFYHLLHCSLFYGVCVTRLYDKGIYIFPETKKMERMIFLIGDLRFLSKINRQRLLVVLFFQVTSERGPGQQISFTLIRARGHYYYDSKRPLSGEVPVLRLDYYFTIKNKIFNSTINF